MMTFNIKYPVICLETTVSQWNWLAEVDFLTASSTTGAMFL